MLKGLLVLLYILIEYRNMYQTNGNNSKMEIKL